MWGLGAPKNLSKMLSGFVTRRSGADVSAKVASREKHVGNRLLFASCVGQGLACEKSGGVDLIVGAT